MSDRQASSAASSCGAWIMHEGPCVLAKGHDGHHSDGRPEDRPATAPSYEELREELMRCGALAISDRADGCVPKTRALKIREIAYRACWPEEAEANG